MLNVLKTLFPLQMHQLLFNFFHKINSCIKNILLFKLLKQQCPVKKTFMESIDICQWKLSLIKNNMLPTWNLLYREMGFSENEYFDNYKQYYTPVGGCTTKLMQFYDLQKKEEQLTYC